MGSSKDKDIDAAQVAAATLIQRLWRGKNNRAREEYMTPDLRWNDAAINAKLAVDRQAAYKGKNSPRERWKRAGFLAARLQDGDDMLSASGVQGVDAEDKHLETQHWLELVDGKHRYGSNLKWYHRRWQEDDTSENFFKWLDQGGGKSLSLDECPREQLEKERIIYLSAEQRLNYLVKISEDGKLLWAKNNQPVDTTAGDWKDAGEGRGIIPDDVSSPPRRFNSRGSISSGSSADQENAATHYVGGSKGKYRWTRYFRRHFTPRGVVERLLRKTVQRNTWIYVSDKNFNMFIGIKETGAFQHSSFTAGGLVTSAGLISVKHGVIYTLSPLSGHYRTSVNHFHKFIDVLTERGVDMRKVKVSKAEAALWGIEHLAKFKKAQGEIVGTAKKKVKEAPQKAVAAITGSDNGSWKRDILQGRRKSQKEGEKHVEEEQQGERGGVEGEKHGAQKGNAERREHAEGEGHVAGEGHGAEEIHGEEQGRADADHNSQEMSAKNETATQSSEPTSKLSKSEDRKGLSPSNGDVGRQDEGKPEETGMMH